MTEPIEMAYEIEHDITRIHPDLENDGYVIRGKFPPERERYGPSSLIEICDPQPPELPNPLQFGIFAREIVGIIDYPYFDTGWPIMSKRMVEVLRSVGPFSHQTYPIEAEDRECIIDPETGKWVTSGIMNYDYALMHLTEHIDALDWENSICERHPMSPHRVKLDSLKKLVITPPWGTTTSVSS